MMSPEPMPMPKGPPDGLGSPLELLDAMLELADLYRQVEQDQEDLLAMERVRTLLQQLKAKEQRQRDGLIQGRADPAALRRFG
jgi:hypothetical protein